MSLADFVDSLDLGPEARFLVDTDNRGGFNAEAEDVSMLLGTTRENLILAVDDEIDSIESFYPKLLQDLEPEGDEDAMATVRYAWASEQQHRDQIALQPLVNRLRRRVQHERRQDDGEKHQQEDGGGNGMTGH